MKEKLQLLDQMFQELSGALQEWRDIVDKICDVSQLDGEREFLECYLTRGADQLRHVLRTARSMRDQYAAIGNSLEGLGAAHATTVPIQTTECRTCRGSGSTFVGGAEIWVKCYGCDGKGVVVR